MESPVFPCVFFLLASLTLTDIRPSNIDKSLLRPSTIKILLATLRCFSVQLFLFFNKRANHVFGQPTSCQFFISSSSRHSEILTEHQCVPLRPSFTQITRFTHHCSCRSSQLFPHLNLTNLPHPSFFLLVRNSISLSILLLPRSHLPLPGHVPP